MTGLVVMLRLIISIQIAIIVTFFWDSINRHKIEICSSKELPSGGPNYTIGQSVFTWKLWPGTSRFVTYEGFIQSLPQFGAPWLEYYTISQRLGYRFSLREANESVFLCPEVDFWCNWYRAVVPYRISNYEDADTPFTDYLPGLQEHITYKANLVSHGGKYIPKGFHIPEQMKQFKQHIAAPWNQKRLWVQKDPAHRGNVVKEVNELDLSQPSLIQEFIANPFLIDGRKFSIGVHVAFPSDKPLRAYVYDSTVVLRFCPLPYDPNDFTKSRSYVCDGMEQGVHFIRQMKSLRNFSMKQEYSTKQSLDAYVDSIGGNSSAITIQIRDAIRDVLKSRKDLIAQNEFRDTRSRYFQWTRWDFLLDEKLNIHLVEVNINPSLHCTTIRSDQLHAQFCNNITYNLFRVLGIASHYDFHERSIHYVVRDSDVHVESKVCYTSECPCQIKECQVCSKCLTEDQRDNLKAVLWEHFTQGETRLVYPYLTNGISVTFDTSDDTDLTREWLRLKCIQDIQWCNNE